MLSSLLKFLFFINKASLTIFSNIIIIQFIIMYQDLEAQQDTIWGKIRRSLYLIVSVTLLTHTISVVYSVMAFR
jgi:hypothetical protein